MKYRKGFVTNSSSSSFIIAKKHLTEKQILAIQNHSELGYRLNLYCAKSDFWHINENEDFITGYTDLDNFSMYQFLKLIGVNLSYVNWGEYPFDINEEPIDIDSETLLSSNNPEWEELLDNLLNKEK